MPADASDELVQFAYERQIDTDSRNSPWYLGFLRGAATERNSEHLNMKLVMEESAGKYDSATLLQALNYFGFNGASPTDEEHVIGTFQARLYDSPMQETKMREYLKIIGKDMGSSKVVAVAENSRLCLQHLADN